MIAFTLPTNFFARLCLMLVHSIWQVSLLLCLATVGAWLFRQKNVHLKYTVHVAALAIALLAMPVTFLSVDTGLFARDESLQPVVANATNYIGNDNTRTDPVVAPSLIEYTSSDTVGLPIQPDVNALTNIEQAASTNPVAVIVKPDVKPASQWWTTLTSWFSVAYLLGVAVMMIRLILANIKASQLASQGESIKDGPAWEIIQALSQRWSLKVVPRLMMAEQIVVPKVVGLLRPAILLPASTLTGLSSDQLELILAHELAHVLRQDMWVNLIQRLAEVVLFFNPALWILSHRISNLREYCCDELACEALNGTTSDLGEPRMRYAEALLRVAELKFETSTKTIETSASLAAVGKSPSELRRRVARLFDEPIAEPLQVSSGGLIALSVAVLLLFIAPTLWSSPATPSLSAALTVEPVEDVVLEGDFVEQATGLLRAALRKGRSRFKKAESQAVCERFAAELNKAIKANQIDLNSVTQQRRIEILTSIRDRVHLHLGVRGNRFPDQVRFPDHLKTLQWKLLMAIQREPLDTQRLAKQTSQRDWMIKLVESLPEEIPSNGPHQSDRSYSHELILERLKVEFADPLNTALDQVMTDEQFVKFKQAINSGIKEARTGVDINTSKSSRYVSVHNPLTYILSQFVSKATDCIWRDDFPVFDDDPVWGFRRSHCVVTLKFKSHRPSKETGKRNATESNVVKVEMMPKENDESRQSRSAKMWMVEVKAGRLVHWDSVDGLTEWPIFQASDFLFEIDPQKKSARSTHSINGSKMTNFLPFKSNNAESLKKEISFSDLGDELSILARAKIGDGEEIFLIGKRIPHGEQGGFFNKEAALRLLSDAVFSSSLIKDETATNLAYGSVVDGLQVAAELVPAKKSYQVGEVIGLQFRVKNVSEKEIEVSSSRWRMDQDTKAVDQNGNEVNVACTWYSGYQTVKTVTLKPGMSHVFDSADLCFGEEEPKSTKAKVGHSVQAGAGRYDLTFGLKFPDVVTGGVRPKEFSLQTGNVNVVVTEKAVEAPANLPDGVYRVRAENSLTPGTEFARSDTDGSVELLSRLSDNFGVATMLSMENGNARFRIDLKGSGPFATDDDIGPLALLIDGVCVLVNSHNDPDAAGRMDMSAPVIGKRASKMIAQKLGVKPRLRRDLGHKMAVRFWPAKDVFEPNEPVMATMEIKNTGKVPFAFQDGDRQRGARNNQFSFSASRKSGSAVPDTGDGRDFGGKSLIRELQPGETFEKQVDLKSWFRLAKPDIYAIQGSYQMELKTEDGWTTWEDIATGDCEVVIEPILQTSILKLLETPGGVQYSLDEQVIGVNELEERLKQKQLRLKEKNPTSKNLIVKIETASDLQYSAVTYASDLVKKAGVKDIQIAAVEKDATAKDSNENSDLRDSKIQKACQEWVNQQSSLATAREQRGEKSSPEDVPSLCQKLDAESISYVVQLSTDTEAVTAFTFEQNPNGGGDALFPLWSFDLKNTDGQWLVTSGAPVRTVASYAKIQSDFSKQHPNCSGGVVEFPAVAYDQLKQTLHEDYEKLFGKWKLESIETKDRSDIPQFFGGHDAKPGDTISFNALPSPIGPIYARGSDKASVLAQQLADGQVWALDPDSTYRRPKQIRFGQRGGAIYIFGSGIYRFEGNGQLAISLNFNSLGSPPSFQSIDPKKQVTVRLKRIVDGEDQIAK